VGKEKKKKRNRRKKIIKPLPATNERRPELDTWDKALKKKKNGDEESESELNQLIPNHYFLETLDIDSLLPFNNL